MRVQANLSYTDQTRPKQNRNPRLVQEEWGTLAIPVPAKFLHPISLSADATHPSQTTLNQIRKGPRVMDENTPG